MEAGKASHRAKEVRNFAQVEMKGMRMQTANQILQALQKLGEKRIALDRIYRNLFSQDLYLAAYGKIYKNKGALTPGTEPETADGMSLKRINEVIEQLRYERYEFRPSRRIEIPKKSGKGVRPLGIPNFNDKLVQEVIRSMLEAYYEPQFRDSSHGFRPEKGCHTALKSVKTAFKGATWFIEGDIKGCFDNIDHQVLMDILSKHIQDGRLLNLIRKGLNAGIMKGWKYESTYSGTPQGGVLSPLLSNIYLNELDVFVEDVLMPAYNKGKGRAANPEYKRYEYLIEQARKAGDIQRVKKLEQERRKLPSKDVNSPLYRRLRYVRYADDFILSFTGTKAEAEAIKTAIGTFLRTNLKLEMSENKTLITHARTEKAKFLGYEISIYKADDKLTPNRNMKSQRRSANGHVRLGIPYGLAATLNKRYIRNGKVVSEASMTPMSDVFVIDTFQARFRGIAEYYKYAVDRSALKALKNVMQEALVKTLAQKYKVSVSEIYKKYRGTQTVKGYEYITLQTTVPTQNGERTFYWGAIPLKVEHRFEGTEINDVRVRQEKFEMTHTDLIDRLRADRCEICGKAGNCEVHHIRKLANLKTQWAGRSEKPIWVIRMIAMQRKTLIVCHTCHVKIHNENNSPK